MNVLVIGSGGREHAICWKLKQSSRVEKIYCAPGNGGIESVAECVNLNIEDFKAIADFVRKNMIELTFVGPEVPLAKGIVDYFEKEKLNIFGPNQKASQLEASKAFSKDIMKKYNVPTARYEVFDNFEEAKKHLDAWPKHEKVVVKADGLAQGKGVIISENPRDAQNVLAEIMHKKVFGSAGDRVVIEQFLDGEEASCMVFVDGMNFQLMASAQDHKRVFDNDLGPNTGGMGAYAPAPVFTDEIRKKTEERIIRPMIDGLLKEGIVYKGVLYAGLMIVKGEPLVIEFNCRFGDPETQVVLPLLKSDLVDIAENVIGGTLDKFKIEWYNKSAVCVVLASGGYPGSYEKGKEITGLKDAETIQGVTVFHAGTVMKEGRCLTSGGRVLGVTAVGGDIKASIDAVYKAVEKIKFDKIHFRKDIGHRALKRG